MDSLPLPEVSPDLLPKLCETVWSMQPCPKWPCNTQCDAIDCSTQRRNRLLRYFDCYRKFAANYCVIGRGDGPRVLKSHGDLFRVAMEFKRSLNLSRAQLAENIFTDHAHQPQTPAPDQQLAISLAVKVVFMMHCGPAHESQDMLEVGLYQPPWRIDVPFSQFMFDVFPVTDHPGFNTEDRKLFLNMEKELVARKLTKVAGLRFRPTDDLRCHLRLDRRTNTVDIFHHTAFLKEHLLLTKVEEGQPSITNWVEHGALPRQLVLEALDSIQKIIFPYSDKKSHSILTSLVSSSSFDPDCLRWESAVFRNSDEKDISYRYFGARLAELYEEVQNPRPHGRVEKWLHRRSGARHVMLATLAGVLIAVLLGVAALAVSIYQAWIGYQAWKHPVPQPAPVNG